MMTGLRRILVTALLGALVGLGMVAVLFGRRPRTGAMAEIEAPPPAPSPALPPSPTPTLALPTTLALPPTPALPPALTPPARTQGRGRLALAAGLAALLLLAGGILASRDFLFGPRFSAPDGGRPLTALSPPQAGLGDAPAPRADAPVAGPAQPDRPVAGGSDSFTPSESRGRPDAGDAAVSPPPPRMRADVTAPRGRQETSDPATAQARAAPERADGSPSPTSPNPAKTPRSSGRPVADAAEPTVDAPAKVVGGEAADVGRLPVTDRTDLETGLRLVLNDPRIAPATVGRDGRVTFDAGRDMAGQDMTGQDMAGRDMAGRDMRPGAGTVRLDAAAGRLREQARIPLSMPVPQRDGDVAVRPKNPSEPDDRQPFSTGSVSIRALPRTEAGASKARVPGLATILVTRGDTLWSISRRTYGKGRRYTLIHDANPDQVRNPNLIRPGQILVLPRRAAKRG